MSINLVTRRQCGLRPARSAKRFAPSKASTVHWMGPTTTVAGRTTWGHDKCPGLVRGIQNFHMDGQGWSDIAYNFLVCPHGVVFEGRGLNVRSAANGTNAGNSTSHAICALAGEGNPFSESEKKALRDARDFIDRGSSAPGGLMCHSDHKSTACPGDARRNWVRGGQGGGGAASSRPGSLPTLRRGSRGDHVRVLQTVLNNRAGQRLAVDGDFGPSTEAAVKNLQRFFGLSVDGVVGPRTWNAVQIINR